MFVLAFAVGFVWLTSWLDDMGPPPIDTGFWFPVLMLVLIVVDRPRVRAWLEYGRSSKPGQWRTTRATRIAAWCSILLMGWYGCNLPLWAHQAWKLGDMPRFAGAAAGSAAWFAVILLAVLRRARTRLELVIDEQGIFAAEWRCVVPWRAIDFVLAARKEDDSMRFVLKPDALAGFSDFVRRRNGFLDLDLAATPLTASAALDALRAACPTLEIRRLRSAGLVLPVRGATDIVEADL
ncbi:MAG: hypothetical protein J7515_07760 [Caulobacter sp.]|nr:hypothetical protein [Caulobacter sp.]